MVHDGYAFFTKNEIRDKMRVNEVLSETKHGMKSVLGKLGPGKLGPGRLGPSKIWRQIGPRQIGPFLGPNLPFFGKLGPGKLGPLAANWAPANWAPADWAPWRQIGPRKICWWQIGARFFMAN